MSKQRILVITALIASAIALLLVGIGILSSLSTFESSTYQIADPFTDVRVITDTANVFVIPADDRITAVDCYELTAAKHTVSVKDGTLTVEVQDNREWYHHIGVQSSTPAVNVYLPAGVYSNLTIEGETGNVEIASGFRFTGVDVAISTGDVTCKASATGDIALRTSTGTVRAEQLTADSVHLTTTTGDAELSIVRCKSVTSTGGTGNQTLTDVVATETLSVESDTGNVRLNGCDANTLCIQTETGNVSGSLLSEKVFVTHTDTGRVVVPDTTTGGKCEITTDTGDIAITIP